MAAGMNFDDPWCNSISGSPLLCQGTNRMGGGFGAIAQVAKGVFDIVWGGGETVFGLAQLASRKVDAFLGVNLLSGVLICVLGVASSPFHLANGAVWLALEPIKMLDAFEFVKGAGIVPRITPLTLGVVLTPLLYLLFSRSPSETVANIPKSSLDEIIEISKEERELRIAALREANKTKKVFGRILKNN